MRTVKMAAKVGNQQNARGCRGAFGAWHACLTLDEQSWPIAKADNTASAVLHAQHAMARTAILQSAKAVCIGTAACQARA